MDENEERSRPNAPHLEPVARPLAASDHLTLEGAGPRPEPTELWVCLDCHMAHHYPGEHAYAGDHEPWALYADEPFGTITDWSDPEDESGYRDFSWSRCDGCGSQLGGSRHRYAYWGS